MTSPTPAPPTDRTRCPLCGADNRCAMELERDTGQPQPPCWCTRVDFSAGVLARIPAAARGQACLCQRCATAALTTTPDAP